MLTPVLWPPRAKSWLIGKDSDAGRDWGQKGTTEDEIAGWHHRLGGRESEWTLGVGDGQGGLVCCNSWGHRVGHDWATDLIWFREIQICLISFKYHSHNQKTLTVVQDVCCSVASSCPTLHDCGLKVTRLTIFFFFLPKFMSIESVMPSNHLILSPSSPSAFNLSQHQGLPMMCK